MTDDRIALLLEKLHAGDDAAATEVFVAFEPYLRMVVRRRLSARHRAKFDSMDIVQSVWADLIQGFRAAKWEFHSPAQLRSFLITLTKNRFIDRHRKYRNSLERDRPLEDVSASDARSRREPKPSELAQAGDIWEQILAACSPLHRQVLAWKREGRSAWEIASLAGLNEGSVRRILRELEQRWRSGHEPPSRPAVRTAQPAPSQV